MCRPLICVNPQLARHSLARRLVHLWFVCFLFSRPLVSIRGPYSRPFAVPIRGSEGPAGTTFRLWLVRETRRRPGDQRLRQRGAWLRDRAVVESRERPVFKALASGAALADIFIRRSRRHYRICKALNDQHGRRDRSIRDVLR
jgi:hypothetical protein